MTTGQNGSDGNGGCIEIKQAEYCRFAYTLNNTQPVRCSIIGDEPLFFMDFDSALIDDEFADELTDQFDGGSADPFGINTIEEGVAALRQRIMGGAGEQGARPGFSELAEIRLEAFFEESGTLFGPAAPALRTDAFRLKALEKTLRASRFLGAMLDFAGTHGIALAFSRQTETGRYDREAGRIFLNPDRDETDLALLAIRELRRAWQHRNGALLHPLTFHPDQAILVNRAQHADLGVARVRGAWELQLAGNKDVWERLEMSADEDLTRAFAREAYLDFRTIASGQAASAVFEAWFLSDRCRIEDRTLIQNMLSDYQGYVFDGEQASRAVGADLVTALGSVPFGKNYLAPFVSTICGDPLFTEVRDRSNANFLWFIKFEKSFRDAERELQPSSSSTARAASAGASITKKQDGDDHGQKADILALPGRRGGRAARSAHPARLPAAARDAARAAAENPGSARDNAGGNIVYLDRGRTSGKR